MLTDILQIIHDNRNYIANASDTAGQEHVIYLLKHLVKWNPIHNYTYLIQCADAVESFWRNESSRLLVIKHNILDKLFQAKPAASKTTKRNIELLATIQVMPEHEYPSMGVIDYALRVIQNYQE